MKVVLREGDLSEDYIGFAQQIGVNGLDINDPVNVPGVREKGYPDLDGLLRLGRRLRAAGLGIFRVTLPVPRRFLRGEPGGEEELEHMCKALECFGKASIPIAAVPVHWELSPGSHGGFLRAHRGGYTMYAFSLQLTRMRLSEKPSGANLGITLEEYWSRCVEVYRRLVPVAEDCKVRLALHPSDPPVPEAPFSLLGLERILDEVPSDYSGLIYCVGTRYESGANIFEEIRHFGRKGKIFHVHFRNVRGTIPSAGGYEEVALGDGDMNMFEVLKALKEVGYDGAVNPDHVPTYVGDTPTGKVAWAYAVGYVKALLEALS